MECRSYPLMISQVNIGSGDGLLLWSMNPLPEPIFTKFYVAIWHYKGPVSYIVLLCLP